jgi:hypothetical protein
MFITASTSTCHLSQTLASTIHSLPPYSTSWTQITQVQIFMYSYVCYFLPILLKKWEASQTFSKIPQYKIQLKFIKQFLSCMPQTAYMAKIISWFMLLLLLNHHIESERTYHSRLQDKVANSLKQLIYVFQNKTSERHQSLRTDNFLISVGTGKKWFPVAARSKGVDLRPLACWNCGFESYWTLGCQFLVRVVRCKVEVSASGWSLVQRSPTECGVLTECDHKSSIMRSLWPPRGCCAMWQKYRENIRTMSLSFFILSFPHLF